VHLLTDDYIYVRQLTDIPATAVCMEGFWVYFSTDEGIFRVRIEGGAVENVILEEYFEPITFYLLDGYLYYPGDVSGGLCNIVRISEDATEHQIIMERVGTGFFVDEHGAYGLGPVDGAPDIAQTDAFFSLPDDAGAQSQYLSFSNILERTKWRIGRLPATEIIETKSSGVIVKARIDGNETCYFSSSDSVLNKEAPRDYFYGPDGAYYELRDYGADLALIRINAPASSEGETVVSEIQKFAYKFHENSLYYFKPMILESMVAYNLWKYDLSDGTDVMVMDFGRLSISVDALSSWNFDKISPELISLEGYLIRPQTGEITYCDRASGSIIEFK
jgi:hypothetical protein